MKSLNQLIEARFKGFGVNKKRETARLVYEISKRDKVTWSRILRGIPVNTGISAYPEIKSYLLKRRFPHASLAERKIRPYLPALKIHEGNAVKINGLNLFPRHIYIEESVSESGLSRRLKGLFPASQFHRIATLKDFVKSRPAFVIKNYNKRSDNFFIIRERYDFFKRCPCTQSAVSCGYHIFNLGFGCVYECAYCYLQEYTNCPGIILPANIEAFFERLKRYKRPGMRLGTGEFSDSLALDHITQYSAGLIEYFNRNTDLTLEFKTKSANIGNILKAKHAGNVVISWSLNPQNIIKENEFYTAGLAQRLDAASSCIRAGYRVGFHFDPIIYSRGWERGYEGLINRLFDKIPQDRMAWISLGTLRFRPQLKTVIENRFPQNRILDEELLIDFDNKMRYPQQVRNEIYKKMTGWIKKRAKKAAIYLCMESPEIQKKAGEYMSIRS